MPVCWLLNQRILAGASGSNPQEMKRPAVTTTVVLTNNSKKWKLCNINIFCVLTFCERLEGALVWFESHRP